MTVLPNQQEVNTPSIKKKKSRIILKLKVSSTCCMTNNLTIMQPLTSFDQQSRTWQCKSMCAIWQLWSASAIRYSVAGQVLQEHDGNMSAVTSCFHMLFICPPVVIRSEGGGGEGAHSVVEQKNLFVLKGVSHGTYLSYRLYKIKIRFNVP